MSWAVVAEDFEQAKENMDVIGALMSFMYPTYSKSSTYLRQGVLFKSSALIAG